MTIYSICIERPVEGVATPPGNVLETKSLSFAAALVSQGAATPNDAATAEAVELAVRMRQLARL
jgi:hypothetical protein